MLQGFTGWHALVLLVVVVLIFGAAKLPALAKSVGQSMKIFKNEVKSDEVRPIAPAAPTDAPPAARLNETSPEVQQQHDANTKP